MSRSNGQPSTMIHIPDVVVESSPEHRCAKCNFNAKTAVGLARHVHEVHGYRGIADALTTKR